MPPTTTFGCGATKRVQSSTLPEPPLALNIFMARRCSAVLWYFDMIFAHDTSDLVFAAVLKIFAACSLHQDCLPRPEASESPIVGGGLCEVGGLQLRQGAAVWRRGKFGRLSKDMKGHRFPVFPEAGRTRPAAHQTTSRLSSLNATDTLMLWTGGLWASSPTSVCQAESTKFCVRQRERERESKFLHVSRRRVQAASNVPAKLCYRTSAIPVRHTHADLREGLSLS